jgi:hypothetical protein
MALYLYGTAQPHMRDVEIYPKHLTSQLMLDEKRAFADSVATHEAGFIPVCIDHAGAERGEGELGRFVVPGTLQIGRVVMAGVRPNGDLMVQLEIFFDRAEARAVADGIRNRKERWGLSLCTNLKLSGAGDRIIDKRVTHVGLTQDPEFANDGTGSRVNAAYLSWQSMDEHFQRDFLDKEPGYYLHPAGRARLAERRALVHPPPPAHLVQVGATASTGKLETHLVESRTWPGPAHSPLALSTMSSEMATPPAPASAPAPAPVAAAAPAPVDYQGKLGTINGEVDARFAALFQGQMPTPNDELSVGQMDAAAGFLEKYDAVMKQAGLTTAKTPYETNRRLMLLQQYIEVGKEAMRKHRAEISTASLDPMDLDFGNKVGEQWNESPPAHNWAQEVIASHNSKIRNQRQYDAQLRAKAAELEVKDKEYRTQVETKDKEVQTLKRDRDTFEAQSKQLAERLDAIEKRMKVDQPAAAAGAQPAVAVDVGASRGTAEPEAGGAGNTWASLSLGSGIWKTLGDPRVQAMADSHKTDKRVSDMLKGITHAMASGKTTIPMKW